MLHHMLRAAAQRAFTVLDPYFKYVTMLLHGDGTNGAQNNTFVDSSTNNFTITRNGNTTQGTFTPYGSNWSNYFGGSSDYLTMPDNANYVISGDFTVEAWIFPTSFAGTNGNIVLAQWPGATATNQSFQFYVNSTGKVGLVYGISVVNAAVAGTSLSCTLNTWNHIAVTRSGSTVRFFVNGSVDSTTATVAGSFNDSTGVMSVGRINASDSGYFSGYISNCRLVIGTALYTSAFTPSTTPLTAISGTQVLVCQSSRFLDASSNNATITVGGTPSVQRFSPFSPTSAYSTSVIGGSGYFDGSGDYLSAAQNTAFNFGTGAFTVEAFVYLTAYPSGGKTVIFSLGDGAVGGSLYTGWALTFSSSQITFYRYDGSTETEYAASAVIPLNAWSHVVAVRNGSSSLSIYLNGSRVLNTTASTTYNNINTNNLNMGVWTSGAGAGTARYLTGYVSSGRIVAGTAVYDPTSSTLTVPTAPLTAISGTSLLMNYTNAGILDNAMMNDLETVGNAQISTSVKKYGTGSISFDATADRLVAASSPNIAFGTGDFTVEFWLNSNNVASANQRGVIQTSDTSGGLKTGYTTGIAIYQGGNATGGPLNGGLTANVAGTFLGSSSAVITTSTWYHIALVRSSGTSTIYVNGTSVGSASTTGNCSGQFICVGGYYDTTYLYDGYLDDLRITKGYARYTSNFTAPTAAFPNN